MKLLIVTQSVDRRDHILGFFHRWIEEFSKHCEEVTVIGQRVIDYDLPPNVKVISLCKEHGASIPMQIFRFWKLCFTQRRHYDAVLVHMTPVWVVLGAKTWFLLRKRVYLWYEVRRGGLMLKLAVLFSRKVFSATPHGLPWPSAKQIVTGHGIDTNLFKPGNAPRDSHLLLALGRITPIKHLELFLDALAKLPAEYRLHIVGGTITEGDKTYLASLLDEMERLGIKNRVTYGFGTQEEVASWMQKASILLHAAGGGLDKAILEAMSSELPVLCTSISAKEVLPPECITDAEHFAERLLEIIGSEQLHSENMGAELRKIIEKDHSLPKLIGKLTKEMSSN